MFYTTVGVLKNFANLLRKHLCQVKCERKSFTLFMQPASSLQKRLLNTVVSSELY